MKPILAMVVAAGVFAAGVAQAENAPAKGDPAKAVTIVNQVCAGCHGADGNSTSPANPKLAGQSAEYITKQLHNFKDALKDPNKDGVRKSAVMGGIVTKLTDQDMLNLGAFFSEKTMRPGAAKLPIAEGQKVFRGGDPATGVPACAACHGPTGAGIPVQFPRLGGQHAEYVLAQLKAFRNRDRQNDAGMMMRTITDRMTEQEMKDVANYVAGLH
jgi:cytochrome c553